MVSVISANCSASLVYFMCVHVHAVDIVVYIFILLILYFRPLEHLKRFKQITILQILGFVVYVGFVEQIYFQFNFI